MFLSEEYDGRKIRTFSLSDSFIEQFVGKQPNWGPVGQFTFKRTYSRPTCECEDPNTCSHPSEEYWETCKRVVEGIYTIQKQHCKTLLLPWDDRRAQRSAQEMFTRIWEFKFTPSGRGFWMMGTDLIYKKGSAALNSCAFVTTENLNIDFAAPFCFLMDMSMLGVGVGTDTRGAGTVKLCMPRYTDEPHIVEDSREGWAQIVSRVLNSFVGKGTYPTNIDYSQVRPRGTPIRTFGGVASGPDPLIKLIDNLTKLLTPTNDEPIPITSTHITDIFNYIGKCVVSGGVRRCLPAGTLIHTSEGLVPIENVKAGMAALTSNGMSKITDWFQQGIQPISQITTQMGTFECTDKHQVAVISDISGGYKWKTANELEPGDRMVFVDRVLEGQATKLPSYNYIRPKHSIICKDIAIPDLSTEMSWFLGLLHGDGYKTSDKGYVSIAIAVGQEAILNRARKVFESFGVNTGTIEPKESDQCYKLSVSSKQLADYLSRFKKPKISIDIPECILQGDPRIRASYVAGLFDADGSSRSRPLVAATSVYPNYLKQVQAVLASLGIPSQLNLNKDKARLLKGWQPIHSLTIVGEKAILRWEQRVATYASKYENKNKTRRSQNDYGFPTAMAAECGITGYKDGKSVWSQQNRQITVSHLEMITKKDIHLVPVEVLKIEHDVREDITYDITVEAHEFVAQDGYLVHNSAEIVFGTPDDTEFLALKQDKEALQDRRWASNNSIFAEIGMDYTHIADSIAINGEPGLAWLENIRHYGRLADAYNGKDLRAMGCNPCFTGDTLIAVADGRNAISIKQLVDEANDIPVYSINLEGQVEIKMGRNPRLTRESAQILEITLDDDSTLRVTPDHKMVLLDGTRCEAQDLKAGDSLPRFSKRQEVAKKDGNKYWQIITNTRNPQSKGSRVSEQELVARFNEEEKTDLNTVWIGNRLHAIRNCEICSEEFITTWTRRGRSYCSHSCRNKSVEGIAARTAGQEMVFEDKQRQTLHLQIQKYKELQENLSREPWKTEWEAACRADQIPVRFRTKGTTDNLHTLRGFRHLKEVAAEYNHRVKSIRLLDVQEPVYNLSVDDNHTVGLVTNNSNSKYLGIYTAQCSEQSLEDQETCNLVETFPAKHDSFEDYKRTLKFAYLYAKTVTLIPTHNPKTNAVMMRNRRIGCSMSGIAQAIQKLGRREFLNWCDNGYKYIQDLDQIYSEWLCIPKSIKMTSVKPSGSVSLLNNSTPGIHYPHSEYYIRNIRVQNTSPLLKACVDAGYTVELDVYSDDTSVVSFPVQEEHFIKSKFDVSVWEQFMNAADMQYWWADNQVSITISFKESERHEIANCLETFETRLKSVSLLPLENSKHGYVQAPYIEITKEQYIEMTSKLKHLDLSGAVHEADDKFCDGDTCTIGPREL